MKSNQRGFTLLEMMLYVAMSAVLVFGSFNLVRYTSQSYTDSRRLSKLQNDGRATLLMMSREVVNTGFKFYMLENPANTFTLTKVTNLTTGENGEAGADGTASFWVKQGTVSDTLEILKAVLDDDKQLSKRERIQYYLSRDTLMRSYREYSGGAWSVPVKVKLTGNAEALQFQFSTNRSTWVNNPSGIKSQIQAVKILLLMRTNNPTSQNVVERVLVGDVKITYPSDGYLRKLYEEIVEVVNNGKV